jgi:hypothetical protein
MQSPPLEWTIFAAHFAVLDYIRARGDADKDTASEVVRDLIDRHPAGRIVGTAVYATGAVALYRHIFR